ncbi:MAG: HAMP domain-containing histidine kinase [Bacteroidetes bacterium]|nr:HAMP domain-containing histidine kinase [Bacteroidota bacterium]
MNAGFIKGFTRYQAGKVALIYLFFSIVWILASDQVAYYFFSDGELVKIETIKGIVFVLTTAMLVYVLVYFHERKNKKLLDELSTVMSDLENKVKQRTKSLNDSLENEKELAEGQKRFISTASHEFRTPLTTILFTSGFIKKYLGHLSESEIHAKLDTIGHQVNHMNDLLNDVLVIAKSDAGKLLVKNEPVNLNVLIGTIVEEVRISTKESHRIDFTPDARCETIVSDERLLRNIIVNLLTNAIKYSPQAASIGLSASLIDGQLEVIVRDSGMGISAEDQTHLFEPFFRGKNITHIAGTGLGLSIVKRAVSQLQGNIQVQSEPNKGSAFIVVLPLVRA